MEPAAGHSHTPSGEQADVAYSGEPEVPNQAMILFSIEQFLADCAAINMRSQPPLFGTVQNVAQSGEVNVPIRPTLFADMPAAGDFSDEENVTSSDEEWIDFRLISSWPFRSFTQLLTGDLNTPTQSYYAHYNNNIPPLIPEENYILEEDRGGMLHGMAFDSFNNMSFEESYPGGGRDVQNGMGSDHFSMDYEDPCLLGEDMQYWIQDFGVNLNQDSYAWDEEDDDGMQNEEGLGLQSQTEISNVGLNELTVFIWLRRSIYISTKDNAQHNPSCCICLMDFKDGEMLGEVECGHKYHVFCIIEWLKNSKTCPLCRKTVMLPN